ncbi:MAG: DUF3108 domain-containing protein [Campylobacterota bacterium]|nr:DUF3108 domain-containing protein [Campylobacterota bacterium]
MNKIILIMMITMSSVFGLHAESIDALYKVSFGMIGEIGKAKAHLEKDGDRYRIEVVGEATGMARALSKNRKEKQVSEGHIRDGLLVPDNYSVIRSFGSKVITKVYTIDHKNSSVEQLNEKTENGKLVWKDSKVLDFYADNDLLTLYFNIATLIPEKDKKATYTFRAVGAEKQQGSVEVIVPDRSERRDYEKNLGKEAAWYLTAVIHQKIFSSSKGELILSIDEAGITQKAMLKDVMMFGDILAERVH